MLESHDSRWPISTLRFLERAASSFVHKDRLLALTGLDYLAARRLSVQGNWVNMLLIANDKAK